MSQKFDAIVVGAGQAGPSLAGRLTGAGMTVAMIERKLFGGTCVNTGCIPTKTLIASAYAAQMARRGSDFGVVIDAPIAVDMKKVKARKDEVSGDSRRGLETWLDGMERCTVFRGHARFESPHDDQRQRRAARRRTHLPQSRRSRPGARHARPRPGQTISPTRRSSISTRCRGIWRSSAAAISGSNSRRCTAASAPR